MTTTDAPIVSHGRGGQGNISADSTQYVDAEITRQGVEGDQGDGAYSAGRGGAGNIASPHVRPTSLIPHDADVIPDMAVRHVDAEGEGGVHVGRGGQGNTLAEIQRIVSKDEGASSVGAKAGGVEGAAERSKHGTTTGTAPTTISTPEGLADKLKYKIFGRK